MRNKHEKPQGHRRRFVVKLKLPFRRKRKGDLLDPMNLADTDEWVM